jgi:hypothetical protein
MPLALAAAAPYIATGLSALAGGLFGRKKARTQEQTFEDFPTFSPEGTSLRDRILAQLMQSLDTEPELPTIDFSSLRQKGISDVNRATEGSREAIAARLAERGLSFSPAAGSAVSGVEQSRSRALSDFLGNLSIREEEERSQLPLIREQLKRQRLVDAQRFLPSLMGSRRTGTGVSPGSALGGALGSGAKALFTGLGYKLFNRE